MASGRVAFPGAFRTVQPNGNFGRWAPAGDSSRPVPTGCPCPAGTPSERPRQFRSTQANGWWGNPLCGVAWAFLPARGEVTRHAEWLRHSLMAGESASSGQGTCAIDMDHGSGHHSQGVPLDSGIGDLTFGAQLLRNLNTSKRFACRASGHGRITPEIVTTFMCFF